MTDTKTYHYKGDWQKLQWFAQQHGFQSYHAPPNGWQTVGELEDGALDHLRSQGFTILGVKEREFVMSVDSMVTISGTSKSEAIEKARQRFIELLSNDQLEIISVEEWE